VDELIQSLVRKSKRCPCVLQSIKTAAVVIIIQVAVLQAVLPQLSGDTLRAQTKETMKSGEHHTQGGTLAFGTDGKLTQNGSSYVETIGLEGYVGQPLKALQLRVISKGGVRLRSVERGADIQSNAEWNLSHVIVHGKSGVDTAKVVIFGFGTTSLPVRQYSALLTVTYDVLSSNGTNTATFSFSGVLGALARGENANIVAAPQHTVSLKNDTRK
jgi:hypothetical protein